MRILPKTVPALLLLAGAACTSTSPRETTTPALARTSEAPDAPREEPAEPIALPDPCAGATSLVIEPIAPIEADWQGALVVGGWARVTVRWCGQGTIAVEALTVRRPDADGEPPLRIRNPAPERARLAHGDALVDEVWGAPTPATLVLEVTAVGPDGAALAASAPFESVDDPERARLRAECAARGGRWGPQGLAQGEMCDAPTRDAGQRCLSDDECEGPCIDVGTEPLPVSLPAGVEVPACGPGREPRLLVGRCHDRSIRFGCHPRLHEVTIECIAPGFARRAHTVCVD
jgi:hypothetical protein